MEKIPDSAYDPMSIVNTDFEIEYGGIDRKVHFVDYDLPRSETNLSSLKERALYGWKTYSEEFEKEQGAKPADMGMLIYTTKGFKDLHIMIEKGKKLDNPIIYFRYQRNTYKVNITPGDNRDVYGKDMVPSHINAAKDLIDQMNLSQRSASNLS